jgi:hypothetical protein
VENEPDTTLWSAALGRSRGRLLAQHKHLFKNQVFNTRSTTQEDRLSNLSPHRTQRWYSLDAQIPAAGENGFWGGVFPAHCMKDLTSGFAKTGSGQYNGDSFENARRFPHQ